MHAVLADAACMTGLEMRSLIAVKRRLSSTGQLRRNDQSDILTV